MKNCSIVLSTFNRLAYLKKCLEALLAQDFSEYEIVIVNDGSTDDTKEFLDSLSDPKIKIIHHKKNLGLSVARNTGIKNTYYDIIAFTDDDCLPEKNWLSQLVAGFDSENVGLVIGQVFYIDKNYKGYFPERLVQNIKAHWPMGANVAYHKKVFDTCGYFDPQFFKYNNEDSEMAIRTVSYGFDFKKQPTAVVCHQADNWTTRSLLKSAHNGSVWPILKKKYPKDYLIFKPPIKFGLFVNYVEYFHILIFPIIIPILFIRYLAHGKRDLKIFFTKWPIYLLLKRFYIYEEAIKNKILML
ncbi:glycosyltransferase [Patescibacteria group bacterium]|nr:glycosyltransferase [Patescibacteria group bacterium]